MNRNDAMTQAAAMLARVEALPERTTESDMRWSLMQQLAAFGGNPLTEFMLTNGKDYATGPKTYAGRRKTPKRCFQNAAHLAISDPTLTYVEGKITCHGVPLDHAWCVDSDGLVVDPTIAARNGKTDRIGNYFGVEFRTDYLLAALATNEVYGLLGWLSKTMEPLLELGLEAGQQALLNGRKKTA